MINIVPMHMKFLSMKLNIIFHTYIGNKSKNKQMGPHETKKLLYTSNKMKGNLQ